MRNWIIYHYLNLVQKIYGKDRLGWDESCQGPKPVDFRSRLAGFMLMQKNF